MNRGASPQAGRRLRSRSGSASAIVVLLTVFLAVFGVLSLVSSYSSLKLADRHRNWSVDYYRVDALAEETLAGIEADLRAAALQAGSTAADSGFPKLAMDALLLRVPEDHLTLVREETGLSAVVRIGPGTGEKDVQSIRVSLWIGFGSDPTSGRLATVVGWRQWQKPFEYKEGYGDLWEGEGLP